MKESKKEETKDSLISLIFPHRRPVGSPSFKKSTRSIDWSGKNKTKTGTGFAGKVECFIFLKNESISQLFIDFVSFFLGFLFETVAVGERTKRNGGRR